MIRLGQTSSPSRPWIGGGSTGDKVNLVNSHIQIHKYKYKYINANTHYTNTDIMVVPRFKKNHPDHSMCWTRHGEDGFYSVVDAHNHFRLESIEKRKMQGL